MAPRRFGDDALWAGILGVERWAYASRLVEGADLAASVYNSGVWPVSQHDQTITINLGFSLQTFWLLFALLGVAFAIMGAGDGPFSARLTLVASLLVLAWMVWVRLPMAGANTAIELHYDKVLVCDEANRCETNPGGLAGYPLGRAISENRWVRASLVTVACTIRRSEYFSV